MSARETCHYHTDKQAIATCDVCGHPLCPQCVFKKNGKTYCCVHQHPALRRHRGDTSLRNLDEVSYESPRRWSTLAALAAGTGLAGIHRLYLGRFLSGLFRLGLFIALVTVARQTLWHVRGDGFGVLFTRFFRMVAFGVVTDLLCCLAGNFLTQRVSVLRGLAMSQGGGMVGDLTLRTAERHLGLGPKNAPFRPVFSGPGAYFSFFFVYVILIFDYIKYSQFPKDTIEFATQVGTPCFLAIAATIGILWEKDLLAIFLRNSLLDADGKIPS